MAVVYKDTNELVSGTGEWRCYGIIFLAVFNKKPISHMFNMQSNLANLMVGLWLVLDLRPSYFHE